MPTIGVLNLEKTNYYTNLTTITPSGMFSAAANGLLVLAGVTAFVILLYGGFLWVASGGDKDAVARARRTIMYALLGLIVSLAAFMILRLVAGFTGTTFISSLPSSGGSAPAPTSPPAPTIVVVPATPVPTLDPAFPTNTPYIPPPEPPPACGMPELPCCLGDICYTGICVSGMCEVAVELLPLGSSCVDSSLCTSGFCGADSDNDTYFVSAITTGTCMIAPTQTDCDDSNTDVHPGQYNYFELPINGIAGNFDYDCSGTNDKDPVYDCLRAIPDSPILCSSEVWPQEYNIYAGWDTSVPACGQKFFAVDPVTGSIPRFWNCCGHDTVCGANPWYINYVCPNALGLETTCPTTDENDIPHTYPAFDYNSSLFFSFGTDLDYMPCK